MPGILLSVVVGSVALSLIGSIGAALTLGIEAQRRAAVAPDPAAVAAGADLRRARHASSRSAARRSLAPLELLAALAVLGVTLAPLAAAAAVRISLE